MTVAEKIERLMELHNYNTNKMKECIYKTKKMQKELKTVKADTRRVIWANYGY